MICQFKIHQFNIGKADNSKFKTQNSKKIALNGTEGTLSSDDEGQSMVGSGKLLTWMQRPHPALSFIII